MGRAYSPQGVADHNHMEAVALVGEGFKLQRELLDTEAAHLNAMVRNHRARRLALETHEGYVRQVSMAGPGVAA